MSLKPIRRTALAATIAALTAAPAMAASSADPYLKPDQSWISLSGTAVDMRVDEFTLEYADGIVTVEMDDWDWYNENRSVLEGDEVTVYGEVDDDLFESTSIEASSVYVEDLGTYFYASSADEEVDASYDYWVNATPIVVGEITVRGTVTSTDGREFTIDTGKQSVKVDTTLMDYNPLDAKGFQQIDKNDYVSVTGQMDRDVWEKRELMADFIVSLQNDE